MLFANERYLVHYQEWGAVLVVLIYSFVLEPPVLGIARCRMRDSFFRSHIAQD